MVKASSSAPPRASLVRSLLLFALFAHAMWLFGNLYEEVVFVPNGMVASVNAFADFNAYFTSAKPYVYYVPLTQLGSIALLVALALAWQGSPDRRGALVRAVAFSLSALALTAFIVLTYNLRLWLGDVRMLTVSELHSLTWRWGAWNLLRIAFVFGATREVFVALDRSNDLARSRRAGGPRDEVAGR